MSNLVGTARAVSDHGAREFAEVFYGALLGEPGETLGAAVLKARQATDQAGLRDWDAYQLYGDPDFRFWDDVVPTAVADRRP